jgi:hypothetical protein
MKGWLATIVIAFPLTTALAVACGAGTRSTATTSAAGTRVTVPDPCAVLSSQEAASAFGSKLTSGYHPPIPEGTGSPPFKECLWDSNAPGLLGGVRLDLYGPPRGAVFYQGLLAESRKATSHVPVKPTTTSIAGVPSFAISDGYGIAFLVDGILARITVLHEAPGASSTVNGKYDTRSALSLVAPAARNIATLDR